MSTSQKRGHRGALRRRGLAVVAVLIAGGGLLTTSVSAIPSPASFVAISPCRLADTRPAPETVGPRSTPLGSNETYSVTVRGTNGNCTLPTTMVGVSLNVTIVNPTASSFLTVFPADVNRPLTANLNWLANQPPTPNAVTVALSSDGKMSIYNLSGSVDFTIDVFGYYEPASSGPPGATGPIGPQGIAGPKGDPGVNGINDSDPATFVRGQKSVTSCVAILTPPVGRAVVVRSIHINVYQNTTPGFGNNVLLYIGTGCVGGFLEAVNPATIGMVDLSYEPGVIIPAGSSLFANRQNNVAAEVLAIGYSVLASAAVPIATLDESRSSTPGPNVDGADS